MGLDTSPHKGGDGGGGGGGDYNQTLTKPIFMCCVYCGFGT